MEDFLTCAMNGGTGAELQDATGIARDNRLGFRATSEIHFLREKLKRRLRLRDVIDSGRAAAMVGERHFDKLDSGNRAN